jgi:hypothetical protein
MATVARCMLTFLAALVTVACSGLEPPTPTANDGPLVTVMTRGGECPDGPCGSLIAIAHDGRVRQIRPDAVEIGVLTSDTLTALDSVISTTDFSAIQAVPFAGECPTAFDGQEVIYEFASPGGPVRIASCEVQVDPQAPVFAGVAAALTSVGAAPP